MDSSLESQVELTDFFKTKKKLFTKMGIGRDSWHKRRKTGGRKPQMHKKKYEARAKSADVAANLNSQFLQGKLLAKINSRPGQCGRADGYILEGEELDFYVKKLKTKKSKA